MTKQTFKTYTRKTTVRAAVTAIPELTNFSYEIETTEDGRFKPVFAVATEEEAALIREKGFDHYPVSKSAPKQAKAKRLDERAMLASLSVTGWSGRMTDEGATAFTLQQHQAKEGWGKFTKRLVSKEALKAIKAAEAAARKAHKELTLPWDEKGYRILPSAAWEDYAKRIGDAKQEWEHAVDALLSNYETVIKEAEAGLGGLFSAADYPSKEELLERFGFDNEVKALDVKGDFRVQIGNAEIERLQAKIQEQTQARLNTAMSDVYRRLHEVVSHMAERLRAYKVTQVTTEKGKKEIRENPFRDATLQNVEDILTIMPALNLTNDPTLDELTQHVRKTLLAANAKELREDADKREATAQAAEEIASAMAGMM